MGGLKCLVETLDRTFVSGLKVGFNDAEIKWMRLVLSDN